MTDMMTTEEEINSLKFRKVSATIPQSLYEKLQKLSMFNSNWDMWLTRQIIKGLADMGVDD